MNQVIFIKPVSHVQIGHVFEHIYCHQLADLFRVKGLFAYVDYSIDGKTFYDGYIRLEVKLHTERARQYEHLITSFQPTLDEGSINGALLQIMAEKYADVHSIDRAVLHDTLVEIAHEPWLNLDSVDIMAYKQKRKTHTGLVLTRRSARRFLNLKLSLSLSVGSTSLAQDVESVLFVVIVNALQENLQEIIADSSFCYSVSDTFRKGRESLIDINVFRIDKRQATTLTTELEVTHDFLKTLPVGGFSKHLATELEAMSLDDIDISEKVSVVVGAKGWRRIAKPEYIDEVLKHITLSFEIAGEKQTLSNVLPS